MKKKALDYRESLITGYKALKFITIVWLYTWLLSTLLTMIQTLRKHFISSLYPYALFLFCHLVLKRRIEYELGLMKLCNQNLRFLNKSK